MFIPEFSVWKTVENLSKWAILCAFVHPARSCQGGGFPFGKAEEIWSYLFSTSKQPFQDSSGTTNFGDEFLDHFDMS